MNDNNNNKGGKFLSQSFIALLLCVATCLFTTLLADDDNESLRNLTYKLAIILGVIAFILLIIILATGNIRTLKNQYQEMTDKLNDAKPEYTMHIDTMSDNTPFIPSDLNTNLDVIIQLKQLLDDGTITQAEYDAQKKKLLGI